MCPDDESADFGEQNFPAKKFRRKFFGEHFFGRIFFGEIFFGGKFFRGFFFWRLSGGRQNEKIVIPSDVNGDFLIGFYMIIYFARPFHSEVDQ